MRKYCDQAIDDPERPGTNSNHIPLMLLAQISNQIQTVAQNGIGLGSAIAVVCSWQRNRSILWALLAGILSWFYVIYFALTRRSDEVK